MARKRSCPVCEKGKLEPADDITSSFGGHVFIEKGHRCNQCGEEFIPEDEVQRTIKEARRLGVWPVKEKNQGQTPKEFMRHHSIFMGQKEGWNEVSKALNMAPEQLWHAVRTGKIKAVETHERVYIIPPDEELRLTGKI